MEVTIIGVDCATQDSKVGLALAHFAGGEARIEEVTLGARVKPVAAAIAQWAAGSDRTLLALDAPLGWPVDLCPTLADHMAGEVIRVPRNDLFRRETDRFVHCQVEKLPFAVGADKIAHTAHDALERLDRVRELTGQPIPLAWDREIGPGIHVIEVYPGATLAAYGIQAKGYKNNESVHRKVLVFLGKHLRLPADTTLMEDSDNALDAGLCVLAAVDFLRGDAMAPKQRMAKAQKEGWIWVRG